MKAISGVLISIVIAAFGSCKDTESSNMQYIAEMKDSIFKYYPTVASVTVEVKESSMLTITLGDAHLYKAADADRQKTANELGAMALKLFPRETGLEKGKIIVSPDEKNVTVDPATTKTVEINLDSLRKLK